MKRFSILFIFALTILISCNVTRVLNLKHRKYYTERSIISSDTLTTLIQMVSYNVPHVIDEEFSYELIFKFIDTTAAKTKRILNLETDTAIIKTIYDIASVWNWEEETYSLRGKIEILEWKTDSITIKQNVIVDDKRRKDILKFKGKRTFTKYKNW
ncbi:MAG: hypothetical protein WCH34_16985 [Bacteroidota bacterium]